MISLSAVATGLGPQVLECPKFEHGEYHSVGFGEGSNLSTRAGAIRVVVSRMGGTSTSLGTGRANWGVFPRGWC